MSEDSSADGEAGVSFLAALSGGILGLCLVSAAILLVRLSREKTREDRLKLLDGYAQEILSAFAKAQAALFAAISSARGFTQQQHERADPDTPGTSMPSPAAAATTSMEAVMSMALRDIRAELEERGIDTMELIEKEEFALALCAA